MFSGGLFDAFTGSAWERLDSAARAYLRRRDFRSCETPDFNGILSFNQYQVHM